MIEDLLKQCVRFFGPLSEEEIIEKIALIPWFLTSRSVIYWGLDGLVKRGELKEDRGLYSLPYEG